MKDLSRDMEDRWWLWPDELPVLPKGEDRIVMAIQPPPMPIIVTNRPEPQYVTFQRFEFSMRWPGTLLPLYTFEIFGRVDPDKAKTAAAKRDCQQAIITTILCLRAIARARHG